MGKEDYPRTLLSERNADVVCLAIIEMLHSDIFDHIIQPFYVLTVNERIKNACKFIWDRQQCYT